mmetsp:Transcript_12901/g.35111  ORF Transcript_12901/g.35111 Transcript_12901/m.35111 type:complete len:209 (+) Transcript_12901:283-909(+)
MAGVEECHRPPQPPGRELGPGPEGERGVPALGGVPESRRVRGAGRGRRAALGRRHAPHWRLVARPRVLGHAHARRPPLGRVQPGDRGQHPDLQQRLAGRQAHHAGARERHQRLLPGHPRRGWRDEQLHAPARAHRLARPHTRASNLRVRNALGQDAKGLDFPGVLISDRERHEARLRHRWRTRHAERSPDPRLQLAHLHGRAGRSQDH